MSYQVLRDEEERLELKKKGWKVVKIGSIVCTSMSCPLIHSYFEKYLMFKLDSE